MISPLYKPSDQVRSAANFILIFGAISFLSAKFRISPSKFPMIDLPLPAEVQAPISGAFVLVVLFQSALLVTRVVREYSEFKLTDLEKVAEQIQKAKNIQELLSRPPPDSELRAIMARVADQMTWPIRLVEISGYFNLLAEVLLPLAFAFVVTVEGWPQLIQFFMIVFS